MSSSTEPREAMVRDAALARGERDESDQGEPVGERTAATDDLPLPDRREQPGGNDQGTERTFTTPAIPLSVAITGVPDPVPFGGSFLVEGALSGTGAGDHEIVLQANPYPYVGGFKTVGNPELTGPTGDFSFPYLTARSSRCQPGRAYPTTAVRSSSAEEAQRPNSSRSCSRACAAISSASERSARSSPRASSTASSQARMPLQQHRRSRPRVRRRRQPIDRSLATPCRRCCPGRAPPVRRCRCGP
jgi:hypothetical protein